MIWLMFIFIVSGVSQIGSGGPDSAYASKDVCEYHADRITLEQLRVESGIPTIHHFETRCLGFDLPRPGADA